MTTKHLQTFLMEFYSRESTEFVTRNLSKQRHLLHHSPPEVPESEMLRRSSATHSELQRVEANVATPPKPKRSVPRNSSPPSKRAKREEEPSVDAKIDKATQKLTGLVGTHTKRLGAVEDAMKSAQLKIDQFGEVGRRINSLDQRVAKSDKKVQSSLKQNDEKLEKLESRLNAALQTAQQASIAVKAIREELISNKADFAAKLQLVQDQFQQQLDELRKTTSETVANHTKREGEAASEKVRVETELTSTLAALTNVVERQGQHLAHLVQNSVSTGQPQQSQQPPQMQIPQMIVGQQPYTAYPTAPQMAALHQLLPPSPVAYQQHPQWAIPTENGNGGDFSKLLRHLRSYPGFNG